MALGPRNINLQESLSAPEWSSMEWWKELSGGRNMISAIKSMKSDSTIDPIGPSFPKETAHKVYLYHTTQFAVPFLFEKEFHSFWPAAMGFDAHLSVIKTE